MARPAAVCLGLPTRAHALPPGQGSRSGISRGVGWGVREWGPRGWSPPSGQPHPLAHPGLSFIQGLYSGKHAGFLEEFPITWTLSKSCSPGSVCVCPAGLGPPGASGPQCLGRGRWQDPDIPPHSPPCLFSSVGILAIAPCLEVRF